MDNNSTQGFTFAMPKGTSSIIKVIGVGGGGNNALKHMYEKGIHGVDFVICNTDAQTLNNNPVANKVQLGLSTTEGLGAGADPEVGEKAAIESIDDIKASFGQNTKMVFITAGMGGGTGTGAAPVIAKVAKEMGILTVGIVTVPFSFEGKRRLEQADSGLEKLRANVDSLIVINNDKLRQQFGNLGFKQGFAKADEVLTNAAKGMAEVITGYFDVNIDFRDAKSVLQNSGTALMSTGTASGENKAEEAVKKALDSPLLNDNKITGAKNVLLLIRSGVEEVTMDEIGVIMDHIQTEAGHTADIIFGVGTDEELGDAVSVLVIATGFAKEDKKVSGTPEKIKYKLETTERLVAPVKESPFKSRAERNLEDSNTKSGKNFFRLDDEEDTVSSQFRTDVALKEKLKTQLHYTLEEKTEEVNFLAREEQGEPDLFLYNDLQEEDDFHSYKFEFKRVSYPKEKISGWEEEKTIEFSFSGDETTKDEVEFKLTEDPKQLLETSPNIEAKELDMTVERDKQSNNVSPVEKAEEQFTFIDKSTSTDKINERRNKLKEFNSRYQISDEQTNFELVPAFRRKNIVLDDHQASEQCIESFLSESKGRMQIRENRFLNKDVD